MTVRDVCHDDGAMADMVTTDGLEDDMVKYEVWMDNGSGIWLFIDGAYAHRYANNAGGKGCLLEDIGLLQVGDDYRAWDGNDMMEFPSIYEDVTGRESWLMCRGEVYRKMGSNDCEEV